MISIDDSLTKLEIMTTNGWAAVGSRVVVVTGRASDQPNYKGRVGTVVAIHDGPYPVEVEIDHYGLAACFRPERLEVLP